MFLATVFLLFTLVQCIACILKEIVVSNRTPVWIHRMDAFRFVADELPFEITAGMHSLIVLITVAKVDVIRICINMSF